MSTKTYEELSQFHTFEERFNYLKLGGVVGKDTFGSGRYLNQTFYTKNPDWHRVRREVVIRDCGCDLGVDGYEIHGKIIIHHINPITIDDLLNDASVLYDLNNLITVSFNTHQAIHYGNDAILEELIYIPRSKNDTCPWRNSNG